MRPEGIVTVTPQLLPYYSESGTISRMYKTGLFDVDIGVGKYVGTNLTESEVRDFISYFVSDETYRKIFGDDDV